MRNLYLPGRSVVHAAKGAAATSHPLSTLAAIDILKAGGNAMDAAIAACAVQCVVEPMSTGIGGDCFALYSKGGGSDIVGLNGSGRAPAGLTADYLLERGIETIDLLSPHAVTVPGAIDAWDRLMADHGRLGLERVLQPAIRYAEDGFPVGPRTSLDWGRQLAKLQATGNAAKQFLKADGEVPKAGEMWRFPELGRTLAAVAKGGRDAFYTGEMAEDMVGYLQSVDGTHTLDDFAATSSDYVAPISTGYKGYDMVQIPPSGQGITALIMLNILSGFDLTKLTPNSVERRHLEIEATRLAYAARNQYVADPDQVDVPVDMLLSKEFADELRSRIDLEKAGEPTGPNPFAKYTDTVCITVVDEDRNACSFINSLFFPFGSGHVAPKSGVIFQNRGAGFLVQPGHPNCVAPRKRPMHTIIPGMALKDGKVAFSYGVMGGGFQPVGHAHVLTNIIDFGMDVQEAMDSPRSFYQDGVVEVEDGIDEELRASLAAMGHEIRPAAWPIGGSQIVAIDWENGTLAAGSDPRKDGCALGY